MTAVDPHRRLNLLTGDWVLVSPHRLSRPWQGAVAEPAAASGLAHDPNCYLCPGNQRVGGHANPAYSGVHIFENDFPALLTQSAAMAADPLLVAEPETGICRVICYSPVHDRPMSRLSTDEIEAVVLAWASQSRELAAHPSISSITIFENRGEMMGASNPHPHGQIWATKSVPNELAREAANQAGYFTRTGRPLLMDYLERELTEPSRTVCANDHFVVVTPFWAAWPFETLLLPRRGVADLTQLDPEETRSLAAILSDLTKTYDAVFNTAFPYTMGWHQRPTLASPGDGFVLHAHFYPPLLRSAFVRKFMVGFEMLGMPQRDLTPEAAAALLREAKTRIAGAASS
jgi:UDPglucose--hexose-1-phosphate uridylyltransferase